MQKRLLTARHWRRLRDGRLHWELCPRLCKLREGERDYCGMRIHQDAMVRFSPPGRTHGVPIELLEVHSLTHFLPGTLLPAIGKGGTNLSSRLQCNGPTRNAPAADRLSELTEPEEIACWACDLGGETVASRSQL